MKLHAELSRGKTREEVELLTQRYAVAAPLLEEIAKVLTAEIERAILKAEDETILDSPNALATLTSLAARRKALRYALNLVTP